MIDIKLIRENPKLVKEGCRKKGVKVDIDKLLKLDKEKREILLDWEKIRARKNKANQEIKKLGSKQERRKIISEMKKIDKKEDFLRKKIKKLDLEINNILVKIPLPPAPDVPEGKSEKDNVPIKFWSKPRKFSFSPKDYIYLMKKWDLVDLERGAKIGGFRQYVLKNEAVILEQALLQWSIDFLTKKGFTLMRPTSMVKRFALFGTGMIPESEEEIYKVDDDLYLTGTTEVPLMAYHSGEILKEEELPKKYIGLSVAFRKEVGSYGKDVKGIFRVHEFWQTEQIIISKNDLEESMKWHEYLLKNSEEMMRSLEIPYRVVNVCTGELSSGQAKRYDIEAWVPSQNKYRETHSDSYLLDFQTRRLNIRYREKSGKVKYCHSLNNTGIAVPRILIPIIENYQRSDEKIDVPKVLQKYTGFKVIPSKNR